MEYRLDFGGEEAVGKGEDGVWRIEGRSAGATGERDRGGEEARVRFEVAGGGGSFIAAQSIDGRGAEAIASQVFQFVEGGGKIAIIPIGGEPLKHPTAVLDLGLYDGGGEGKSQGGIVGALVLRGADARRAGRGLVQSEHGLIAGQENDGNGSPQTFAQCGDREGSSLINQDLLDVMQKNVARWRGQEFVGLRGQFDVEPFADQGNPGARGGEE